MGAPKVDEPMTALLIRNALTLAKKYTAHKIENGRVVSMGGTPKQVISLLDEQQPVVDPRIDGPVRDPRELVHKLAASERVRQVFVRHAFRFCLERNESLAGGGTLQAADRAYVESGGSFKSLVFALLTSDAFLYRTAGADAAAVSLKVTP